jgi:CreA protein
VRGSVFSGSASLIFKSTDPKRNTLVYVAIGKCVLEGASMNALSAVPIMPWPER